MTALPIFRTAKPSQVGRPVLPMTREDARFWALRRERKEQEQARERQ